MFSVLLCFSILQLTSPLAVAETLPDPETVLQTVENGEVRLFQWLNGEWQVLLTASMKCLLTILLCILALHFVRKYRERSGGNGSGLRHVFLQPVILFVTLTLCFLFLHPIARSISVVNDMDMRLFYAGTALIATWGILGLISFLDKKVRDIAREKAYVLDDLTIGLAGNILKGTVLFLALLFIGQNIFDLNISALLAGAGVIGLGVALASKDTLSNFFGTLVIVGDSPFRLGDRIKAGEIDGIVERVGIRSCRIRTKDESLHTIPNSILAANPVCLISRKGVIKHQIKLGLIYQTTPEQMEQAIRILHRLCDHFHGPDQPDHKPHIYFANFADYALELRLILWLKAESFVQEEQLLNELNLKILQEFNAAGLEFAYPTESIFITRIAN
ncbi:MAG: mechanosensitive ion channel family protein [Lentisphaeria bacterium]|nr:mechanosensitive ion channel family protein [Lentisphaeria bacterium]